MHKHIMSLLGAGVLLLGLAWPAAAALDNRGSFVYTDGAGNTGSVNLIYDADRNLTWVGDANLAQTSGFDADGRFVHSAAGNWATGLTIGGFTDWRLPTTTQPDASCGTQFDPGGGFPLQGIEFGCTGSEMGHLFASVADGGEGITAATPGVFNNVQAALYWSGTEYAPDTNLAWFFDFGNGRQNGFLKTTELFAWAVRTGDVAPVPVPSAILLMGSGLLGLIGWKYRKTRQS